MKELIAALCLALSLCTGSVDSTGYIFVGDSRTVGMNAAVGIESDDSFVVAEVGKGYEWFMEEGFPEVCNIIEEHPEYGHWVMVSNLGVNDLHNAGRYVSLYEQLSEFLDVYVVSVNPCKGSYARWNDKIKELNQVLQGIDGIEYIDIHEVMEEEGFKSCDGLHYTAETYKAIYEMIADVVYGTE